MLTLQEHEADSQSMVKVLKWVVDNDVEKPTPLTRATIGTDVFAEVVKAYQAAHAIHINRNYRGNDIHDAIHRYMGELPLRWDEFAMVHELLHFDVGITKSAKNSVMYKVAKEGKKGVPDFDKIEDYCKKTGCWEEMVQVGERIKNTITAQIAEVEKERKERWEASNPKPGQL
jgi:hypothetical protein